jgi:hypothetical protein
MTWAKFLELATCPFLYTVKTMIIIMPANCQGCSPKCNKHYNFFLVVVGFELRACRLLATPPALTIIFDVQENQALPRGQKERKLENRVISKSDPGLQ